MRIGVALLFLSGAAAQAGIIHGIVLEQASSQPLARTRVFLTRLAKAGETAPVASAITNLAGQFWFPSLADGQYVVTSTRAGFAEAAFGQKRPLGPGVAIVMQGDSSQFAEIRMARLGGITGKVVDENEVGLPGISVHAYFAKLPLRIAVSSKTDDRGIYRLGALQPGTYWVRTSPVELDDGSSFLPTFHPGVTNTQESKVVNVTLDADAPQANLRPLPGRLFKLRGIVRGCPPDERFARVTLSSDTGRKETTAPCNGPFEFDQLAPTQYELLVEPATFSGVAAWSEMTLDKSNERGDVQMVRLPSITHRVEGPSQRMSGRDSANIVLRRQDLAGETHASGPGKEMLPGIWEVWFTPAAGQVWEEITTSPPYIMSRARNRDRAGKLLSENAPRIGVDVGDSFAIHYKVSTTPGTIEGTVRHQSQPMAGAPVFLLANDAAVLQRIHGLRRTITGEDGRFRFSGLPTGSYSLLSSADLDEINKTVMQDYQAKSVTLTDGKSESIVLDLIVR